VGPTFRRVFGKQNNDRVVMMCVPEMT
jgi:hypothetical protein